ncbi:MAG: FAD-binding protein [[Clostridium] scindens]
MGRNMQPSGFTLALRLPLEAWRRIAAARVLDTEGRPIPGLYAAGEVADTGMFGTEYPTCGTSIGGALFYGRIAGRVASGQSML